MINDNEVLAWLSSEIPELIIDTRPVNTERSIYQNLKRLADLACRHILQNDLRLPGRIFKIAEQLFQEGSQVTKIAVDNIFIFSIITHIKNVGGLDGLLTPHLRQEFHRQLYCSGT